MRLIIIVYEQITYLKREIILNRDLTTEEPSRALIKFTLPLFISVMFQQLYNIADSVIAGRYAGEDALAAVGASYPIAMIFMAFAVGSQVGCSVVISRYFGAKKFNETKTCISTTLIAGLVLSALLTVLGLAFSTPLMRLVKTPDNIFADGNLYLRVYTGGFVFLFMYNIVTGIFSSMGDSRTPLALLIVSSVGNVILDAVFVIKLHYGVAGVAWATFIVQGIACIVSALLLFRRVRGMEGRGRLFSMRSLLNIIKVAVPSILQQSFVSVGNMFIQTLVNGFSSSVIAGYSAAIKLNTFAVTSCSTVGNAVSGFTAQNLGAGKPERVRRGFRAGAVFGSFVAFLFFALFFFFGDNLLALFMNEESTQLAADTGMNFIKIVSPFYFFVCIKLVSDGVLRGSESMGSFMAATFTDLILRVILANIFVNFRAETGIWLAWPVSWIIATAMSYFFYKRCVRLRTNEVQHDETFSE